MAPPVAGRFADAKLQAHSTRPEEVAINRHKILTPILIAIEEKADAAKIISIKSEAMQQYGISRRTLGRWLQSYQDNGFEGLKPKPKRNGNGIIIPEEMINEAILLRREVPSRSVPQIIEIMELEGKAPVGFLKRTTLQDRLLARGYSARHMKMYADPGIAARRFARVDRGDMWHSDIKFGPRLVVNGESKQVYLVCFIDDATRYVVHGEFYFGLDASIVEDCFRKAIAKEGLPKRVYFDNGKQYRNKWMTRACAVLDIKLLYAKPYSPSSTGKVERFNRTVDAFLAEAVLKTPQSLHEFNQLFWVWLSECYHTREHATLETTPEMAYKNAKAPLRFAGTDEIASAFLHHEERKVDKSGCISFNAKKYEVGILFIGQTVTVLFDPQDKESITALHKPSGQTFRVKELKIGPHTGPRPKLPAHMTPVTPETSRLLDAKEISYQSRHENVRRAISFKDINAQTGRLSNDELLDHVGCRPEQQAQLATRATGMEGASDV